MADQITRARNLLDSYVSDKEDDKTVAVLNALIDFAPTPRGRSNICEAILRCRTITPPSSISDLLRQLAQRFINGLLIPIKAQGGKTPQISDHPSRQESMELASLLNQVHVGTASRDHNMKRKALQRDNYRSVLSGRLDYYSYERNMINDMPQDPKLSFTQAAHILPFSLAATREGEQQYRGEVWTIIEEFSGMKVLDSLSGNDINRLGNVLTLTDTEHTLFGTMVVWLEKREAPCEYIIRSKAHHALLTGLPVGAILTLGTTDPQLELPDERLIAIHAACAQVLHMSGMAEHIDRIMRDLEEMTVLAEDGTSNIWDIFALRGGISVH